MATSPLLDAARPRVSQFLTDSFQRGLAHWNRQRLAPGFPDPDWSRTLERDLRMQRLEGGFVEELRAEVAAEAAAAPTDPAAFVAWLEALVETLAVEPCIETTVWESLALANAMTAMATSRRYAWHSVGALGVIELTAPGRSAMVAKGLRRIGLSERERRYFDLHALLDVKHSADWNREALLPLVAEDSRRATAIAEGALMRLRCGARCFDRYRALLWDSER